MTKLVDGSIPAHTECPFVGECPMAKTGCCHHKGPAHNVPFSCGAARAFDLIHRHERKIEVSQP